MTSNITPVATSVFHIWNRQSKLSISDQNFNQSSINPQSILFQSNFKFNRKLRRN